MKILFVLPSGDTVYGSGRSIAELAKNLKSPYDLLVGKSLHGPIDKAKLRKAFDDNLGEIYEMWLPNLNSYYGRSEARFMRLAELHKAVMWKLEQTKFVRTLEQNQYDVIHLNSMILAPMLNKKYPMILHVREVFQGNEKEISYMRKLVKQARGVIYINPTVRQAFEGAVGRENSSLLKSNIVPDPFDMTELRELDANEIRKNLGIGQNQIVFAVLGRYEDRNGTEFIAESFHKNKAKNAVLLVVGRISENDKNACLEKTGRDDRIKILGEWQNPNPIFAISDYIIRGERFFSGFSRTVYEGLYAGCKIIFPGKEEDAIGSLYYEEFKEDILFYVPRDESELSHLIEKCAIEDKREERIYKENTQEYIGEYISLLKKMSINYEDN